VEQERERRRATSLEPRAGSRRGASSSTSRKSASARNQRRTARGPDYHELSKELRGKLVFEGFHPDKGVNVNATWKESFTSKNSRREYKDQELYKCWYVDHQSFETYPGAGVRVWEVLAKSGSKGTKGKGGGGVRNIRARRSQSPRSPMAILQRPRRWSRW
jgi:hypothetical protein